MSLRDKQPELHTLADWIRWGASRFNEANLFFGHGTDNAFDEARALVLHAVHLSFDAPDWVLATRVTVDEAQAVQALIAGRVETRKPAAYLTHEAWFAGLSFYVDERVLVPRSPLAEPIQQGFVPWVDPDAVTRVLDLCTGSGCIAIALAYAFPDAEVDAVDVSSDALGVTAINIERHGVAGHVRALHSDLFAGLSQDDRYDLIVSNPPYVDAEDMAALPDEFRHEPELGLAAGDDGLDLVLRMLVDAPNHLQPNGVLVVEVGNSADALEALFPQVAFTWLDFAHGGHGVFLLTLEDLLKYRQDFDVARNARVAHT